MIILSYLYNMFFLIIKKNMWSADKIHVILNS